MSESNIVGAANAYIVSQSKSSEKSLEKTLNSRVNPFVTISRETGAGGTILAGYIVDYMNSLTGQTAWKLYDKNLIEKVIEEHKLPGMYRDFLNESGMSEIEDMFEMLMGLHPGIGQLAKKTCSTILNLAIIGRVVIVGRGANIITKNLPGGFHVRLIAAEEWKIKQIQSLLNLNRKEAARYINDEDVRRKEYVKKLFNKNVADPLLYDIVIKTSSIGFEEAARMIGMRTGNLCSEHSHV
jgi:cytidylate kinase